MKLATWPGVPRCAHKLNIFKQQNHWRTGFGIRFGYVDREIIGEDHGNPRDDY